MDKEDVAHIYNGILLTLVVVRWMDLESVIQSEVSQKEKNKYRMLTHVYEILTSGTWGFPGGAVVESPPADAEDTGSCPGPGRPHMPRRAAGPVSHGR